jgi:hypothetical protein
MRIFLSDFSFLKSGSWMISSEAPTYTGVAVLLMLADEFDELENIDVSPLPSELKPLDRAN